MFFECFNALQTLLKFLKKFSNLGFGSGSAILAIWPNLNLNLRFGSGSNPVRIGSEPNFSITRSYELMELRSKAC